MPNLPGVVFGDPLAAAANTAALQAILNDPLDNVLDFRDVAGDCYFDGTLNFIYPKHIIGLSNGPKLMFRPPGATAVDAIHLDAGCGANGTLFHRIGIDYLAAAGATGRACVARVYESGIEFSDCDLNGNRPSQAVAQINGIWSDQTFRGIKIVGCSLHDFVEYPIYGYTTTPSDDGNSDIYIARCDVRRFGPAQIGISINGGYGANIIIEKCNVDCTDGQSSTGIFVTGSNATYPHTNVKVLNNTVMGKNGTDEHSSAGGLGVWASLYSEIIGNSCQGGYEGIATADVNAVVIAENIITQTLMYGIETGGGQSLSCNGNLIFGGGITKQGVQLDAAGDSYAVVNDNEVIDCVSGGIAATSATFGAVVCNNRIRGAYKTSGNFAGIALGVTHYALMNNNVVDGNFGGSATGTGIWTSGTVSMASGNLMRNLTVGISGVPSGGRGVNAFESVGTQYQ